MTEQVVVTANVVPGRATVVPARSVPNVPLSLVDLGKRLLDASKRGDTFEMRNLLSSGAPFTTDWLGTSPLHFAAMHGHIDIVTILLRAGISRDARTKVDRTPLHVAAQNGNFEVVQTLLKHSAIVDAVDMLKMTPLHWAVENGHTNVVNLLLKNDASTHYVDKFERTPMDIALGRMQMDIVQLLQTATTQQTRSLTNNDMVIEEEVLTTENPEQVLPTDQSKPADNSQKLVISPEQLAVTNLGEPSNAGTSVLEELAALAEATASNNVSTADTASWLSSRGLSLAANNDSGTPLALTEAGKLALTNFMKDQGVTGEGNTVMTLVDEEGNQVLLVQQNDDLTTNGSASSTTHEETSTTDLHIDTNNTIKSDELIESAVE